MTRTPRLLLVALLLAALAAGASAAYAQGGYPITPFRLLDWSGDVFLEGHYRKDKETRDPSDTTNETDAYFQEGVELKLHGYAYHPNLLDWNAAFRLGGLQQFTTVNGQPEDSNGVLLGYNLNGTFLRQKPVSFRLFASQNQEYIDRNFAQAVKVDSQIQGGEILYRSTIPINLHLEHSHVTEDSDLRNDDRDTLLARLSIEDDRSRDWQTRLVYEHQQTSETALYFPGTVNQNTQNLPDQRDEVNLTNHWAWGPQNQQNRLDGFARILHRTGFFKDDLILLDQRLTLAHSPTFNTFYHGQYSSDVTDQQDDRQLLAEVGLRKKFYESLDTSLWVGVSKQEQLDGSQQHYGLYTDNTYRKETPIGVYTSNLSAGYEIDHDTYANSQHDVNNEPVSLSGVSGVLLSQPNVASIISVTDVTHTIQYFEGTDYLITTVGSFTQIRRIAGGSIADPQTVLVTYTVTAGRNSHYHTVTVNWTHRLQLDPWPVALYAHYRLRDQEFDSGDDPGNLDRDQTVLGGVELKLGDFTFTGEHEIDTQRLYPSSHTDRLRALYQHATGQTTVSVSAEYDMLKYTNGAQFDLPNGRDYLETYGIFANLTTRMHQTLLVRLDASYYRSRGEEDDTLIRIGAHADWHYGNMDVSVGGYHSIYTQQSLHGNTDYLGFTVRRSF